jgi:hypothetical protein
LLPFLTDFVNNVCACHGDEQSYVNKADVELRTVSRFGSLCRIGRHIKDIRLYDKKQKRQQHDCNNADEYALFNAFAHK